MRPLWTTHRHPSVPQIRPQANSIGGSPSASMDCQRVAGGTEAARPGNAIEKRLTLQSLRHAYAQSHTGWSREMDRAHLSSLLGTA